MRPQDIAFFAALAALGCFGLWQIWYMDRPSRKAIHKRKKPQ
jgi:hypothetical protein